MEEPLNLMLKARDILVSPNHQGLEILINQLSSPRETIESQFALSLYNLCANKFPGCLSLKLLKIYLSSSNDVVRYQSIYLLSETLAAYKNRGFKLPLVALNEIKPLVISCLMMQETKESETRILGEVVYHVAYQMMSFHDETWFDLRYYIVSRSKTEFKRAVYIFQSLTMALKDEEFVIPVVESILPEINTKLNPPSEALLVDNKDNCWVLAFTGAFCAMIRLIKIPSQAKSVKEIAYKMIDSVRELVERGMEVGELVRRAFIDLENIVKKNLEWFGTREYKFVKGMLWKLYEIKGMESKVVLWRINFRLERGVAKEFKEVPKSELDWINQHEEVQKSSCPNVTMGMTTLCVLRALLVSIYLFLVFSFLIV